MDIFSKVDPRLSSVVLSNAIGTPPYPGFYRPIPFPDFLPAVIPATEPSDKEPNHDPDR